MPANEVDNLSIHKLLAVMRRRKLAIILPTLLVAAAFIGYACYAPARYQAKALVTIDPANASDARISSIEEQLWAVRETLLGRPLLEEVVAEFNLYTAAADRVESITSQISIDIVSTTAFHVGFQGEDPALVARVANRLAELFVRETAGAHTRTLAQANDDLQGTLEYLGGKLAIQNEEIQAYKERVGGALPERLTTNLKTIEVIEGRIQTTNAGIAAGQAEQAAAVREIAELEKRGALDPALFREQSAAGRKLDELKLELAQARTRYTDRNPEVINLARQVTALEQSQLHEEFGQGEPGALSLRYVQLSAELEGINRRLQSQRQEVSSLTSQLRTERSRIDAFPQRESEMALLMRDYATTQESYQSLLAEQNASGGAISIRGPFVITDRARSPSIPFAPHRARLVLMGLVSGLGLGCMIAFGAEQMNTAFVDAEDLAAFTTLPVLGEVASISKAHGGYRNAGRVVTAGHPTSLAAEQYFTLAAKLLQRREGRESVVLAVTSATGGEGKTLTSLNLSIALAKSVGTTVLLVDADLRRPMLHEYLDLQGAKTKGLGRLLLNPEDDLHQYIRDFNGVSVMPTFARAVNPLGMLVADRARIFLDRMRREFPIVVLDCPPIVPVADGHVLASLADHVVLIARARRTPRELFRLAVESLDRSNIIGVVLNDVEIKHSRYSSAYRYYQNNYQAG